ncbi:MAG: hypothetical protein JSW00_04045 [Thermoplasmata archaeon]|nr:MAG: hypothetical protein JSW00_04045 [Thermoplasmata archaeon]
MPAITPILDRVALRKLPEERLDGDLIEVVENYKDNPIIKAEVIAIGPGRPDSAGNLKPMGVKVGDHVLVHKHGSINIAHNDGEINFVAEPDILAVLD